MAFCMHCGVELTQEGAQFCHTCGGSQDMSSGMAQPQVPAQPQQYPLQPQQYPAQQFANSALVCPHCQQKGYVQRTAAKQKKGVSGGKATAAVLTGGVSLLATGLSRKEWHQVLHCTYCGSTWTI